MTRRFRLWAYSPSHGRLVLRALPDQANSTNLDHVFSRVTRVDLPETIFDLSVRVGSQDELARVAGDQALTDSSQLYVLTGIDAEGSPLRGAIVAVDHRSEQNDLPMFETLLDEQLLEARDGSEFEKLVLAALSQIEPPWIPHARDRGFDFFLDRPGDPARQVAVEAKWLRGSPPRGWIRSVVTQMVTGLQHLPEVDAVVVVFGGITDDGQRQRVRDELSAHLITALSGLNVQRLVLAWEDQPTKALVDRVRAYWAA